MPHKKSVFDRILDPSEGIQNVVLFLLSLSSGVRFAMVTVIFSFLLTFLSLRSLSTISKSYLLLLFSILLPLFPGLSSLLPSHAWSSSLASFYPLLSGHLLFANFSSPILSTCPAQFSLPGTPHQFLLKTVLHSSLHSLFIQSSLI